MRLGKALATGVAEEQPRLEEEELRLPEGIGEIEELESSVEEVPVAR
ncbi:hypothetical protein [Streptomyces sp. NBC_00878]|nr:hypothetical protein [Streptomyces sp. NBC_00878]MCX4909706.1 hypothetical protein [Streptomyces sp. NBC_00878]